MRSRSGAKKIAVIAKVHDSREGAARYEPLINYAGKRRRFAADLESPGRRLGCDTGGAAYQERGCGCRHSLILHPKPAAVMIRDSFKLGVDPVWIGQTTINDLHAFSAEVGIPGVLGKFVTITSTKFDGNDPTVGPWNARLKARFPNDEVSPFNMYGVGSAQVFVEGLRRAGRDLTRDKFLAALGSLKDYRSDAYFGPITCNDPVSHQCNRTPGWFALRDGHVVSVQ